MKMNCKTTPILFVLLMLAGCTSSALYNQNAYEMATSVKVDALMLMDKASDDYSSHLLEIEKVEADVEKAYQYTKGLPDNEETARQWEIINDTSRNSFMGFIKKWRTEKCLNKTFIHYTKQQISDGFDAVIRLEASKRK